MIKKRSLIGLADKVICSTINVKNQKNENNLVTHL